MGYQRRGTWESWLAPGLSDKFTETAQQLDFEKKKQEDIEMARYELGRSSSNLLEVLHGGRPRDQEPHVKKSARRKKDIDYILKVDLDEIGISEDEFDDLQSLFQLFDHDRDGILNLRETKKLLRCLGFRTNEEQTREMVALVSCDTTASSISFSEYLRLVSIQRRAHPDTESLLAVFQTFDPRNSGEMSEEQFRRVMRNKEGVSEEDVEDMIAEYKKLYVNVKPDTKEHKKGVIYYKDFINMLQE